MRVRRLYGSVLLFCVFAALGCQRYSGRPQTSEDNRPEDVKDFSVLYSKNCAGCHGADGQHGAAIALANPEYQAIANEAMMRDVISNGEQGTLMPAFAKSAGGMLTDEQVNILVSGMRARWYKAGLLDGTNVPPYVAGKTGDAAHGQQAFITYCSSCHTTGTQGEKSKPSSVTDGSYLALMSDQALRAIIIAGRPDIGHPDWRNAQPGHPMSDQDVTDVVAWISSQRQKTPGQPYPSQQ
ncbi:MAG TPA: c-type cytochrome [Alloacidobacterium sp.]|nr:c-type cytochrome [Alloacidobacterium sp.]